MESQVSKINSALDALLVSITGVLQSRDDPEGQSNETDSIKRVSQAAALEAFHYRLQLYYAACDHAQEALEAARLRLLADSLWDDARGPPLGVAPSESTPGAVLSVARMEEINQALKALAGELQPLPAGSQSFGNPSMLSGPLLQSGQGGSQGQGASRRVETK